jgi:hypothetical protein
MDDLLKLAERVEALTGPDREVDADILQATNPKEWAKLRLEASQPCGALEDMIEEGVRSYVKYRSEYWFTASLDAAMSLVPQNLGVSWRLTDGMGGPTAEVWAFDLDDPDCPELYHVWGGCTATPALALTAAALRAIAATRPERTT